MAVSGGQQEVEHFLSEVSQEEFVFHCKQCEHAGRHLPADGFCLECQEYMCSECYQIHQRSVVRRHHRLQNKMLMPTTKPHDKVKDVCTEVCENHAEKIAEYFCQRHQCFCCSACVATEHHTCEKVDYIPEVAFTFDRSKELSDLQKCLTELLTSNERQKFEINCKSKAVSIQAERAKMHVKSLRSKVDKIFDDLEKKINKSIDTLKNSDENKMEELMHKVNMISEQLQKHVVNIEHYLNALTSCHLFVAAKREQISVNDFSREITSIDQSISIQRYQFTPDPDILEFISSIKRIGTLDDKDQRAKVPQFEKDINIRDKSDKDGCEITGMTMTSEHILVVVDNRNNSVKLIDIVKGDVKCVYKLEGIGAVTRPFDVTKIDAARIAVTYPYRKTIQFLETSGCDQLKMDREIDATGECSGIECLGNNLIVSFRKPSVVKILTMAGKVIRIIKGHFTEFPDYVAVNKVKNLIYISNWSSPGPGSVLCLTTKGKTEVVFEDGKLYGPHGASIDKDGVLYVCGRFLHNVLQLSEDCTMIQELLNKEDGLRMPRCITLSEQNDRLYIGIDSDHIKVFQLY